MRNRLWPPAADDIRDYQPDDAAALFVLHAAIAPAEVGQLLAWTTALDERVELGGRVWVAARGRRPAGYAAIDPLPGLPGIFELTGGVTPESTKRLKFKCPLSTNRQLGSAAEAMATAFSQLSTSRIPLPSKTNCMQSDG